MSSMSEALIGCQPRIDEPSSPKPSSNESSLSCWIGDRGVLPDAGQVDELEVDHLGAVLLCELEDSLGVMRFAPLEWSELRWRLRRARRCGCG